MPTPHILVTMFQRPFIAGREFEGFISGIDICLFKLGDKIQLTTTKDVGKFEGEELAAGICKMRVGWGVDDAI